MGATFVGCISCGTLLVLSVNTDDQGAARAGWRLLPEGWECPLHTVPLTASDLLSRPSGAE
jgi:hypothetical protein